jgi:Mrp family chromosome partitioning ATPase
MFNLEQGVIHQCEQGWVPVYMDKEQRLGVLSIGFLLGSKEEAVIWRGPKKNCIFKILLFSSNQNLINRLLTV